MENKYSFQNYLYFDRWVSYWYQLREVLKLKPESLLIVGAGDGIVSELLKKYVGKLKTLDINESLKPDFIASVEAIPATNNDFETILCAEVLEHLPEDRFEFCLAELKRVVKKSVVLSLPHFGPPLKLSFKLPLVKEIKFAFKIPIAKNHKYIGNHYWEIGKKGYGALKIRKIILKYFKIKKEFVPFENQYHHFYILEK